MLGHDPPQLLPVPLRHPIARLDAVSLGGARFKASYFGSLTHTTTVVRVLRTARARHKNCISTDKNVLMGGSDKNVRVVTILPMRRLATMNKNSSTRRAVRRCLATAVVILSAITTSGVANGEKADAATDSYFSANGLYNRKLYELAAEEYKSFLSKYPNHEKTLNAQLGLALSLYGTGKHADAEPLLAKLAANDKAPEQGQVHLLWGQCLLALDRAGDAEKSFLWGANKSADPAAKESSLAGLIEALFRQQKWPDVVTRSDELVKIAPKGQFSTRARFQGGLARFELKQYDAAAGVLGPLTSEVKNTPLAQQTVFLLAECKRELSDLDGAAAQYEVAARKSTGAFTADALFRLGFVHFVQKKYDDAIEDFDELRGQHKDSPLAGQASLYLGSAYLEKKDFQMAEAVLRPLAGQPDLAAEATLWLAKTFLRQDKYAQ